MSHTGGSAPERLISDYFLKETPLNEIRTWKQCILDRVTGRAIKMAKGALIPCAPLSSAACVTHRLHYGFFLQPASFYTCIGINFSSRWRRLRYRSLFSLLWISKELMCQTLAVLMCHDLQPVITRMRRTAAASISEKLLSQKLQSVSVMSWTVHITSHTDFAICKSNSFTYVAVWRRYWYRVSVTVVVFNLKWHLILGFNHLRSPGDLILLLLLLFIYFFKFYNNLVITILC